METTLSADGNVHIPQSLIDEYHLPAGTRFLIQINDGIIQLLPIDSISLRTFRGILDKGALEELIEMRTKERSF